MEFADWLNNKYIAFRGNSRATISEFAQFCGVPQSAMSKWMGKGGEKPARKNIAKLAGKLGPEVYDLLGLPRPPLDNFEALPPAMREALSAASHELKEAMSAYKLDPLSPEAETLSIEIMERHGFKWIATTADEQPG